MHVIGVLNTKGGSAKTTVASCLAVRAAADAPVAMLDLDPQQSLSEWHGRRGSPSNPALIDGAERASDAVETLRMTTSYEYVFMDGPPGALLVTEDAVRCATLVVVPLRPSGLDVGASRDAIQLCQDAGVPLVAVIADRGQHDGKLEQHARTTLERWGVTVADTAIAHRTQYVNAVTTGSTGPEKDRRAAEEIDRLWAEIVAKLRETR